jgi:hypothetical protein
MTFVQNSNYCRRRLAAAVAAIAAVCAGPAVPVALAQEVTPCAALAGRSIEPALIGLPGGPARIAAAAVERLPASQAAESTIGYCKVLGEIAPLDPAAPPIRFEVNLPEQWNGKAVQYGGGGFNGVLITGLDPLRDARLDTPVPVARGYATWGTDSGHDGAKHPEIQAFALNAEALENYAFASYTKVRDAAIAIVRAHYGMTPRRIYYYGGSEGGRGGDSPARAQYARAHPAPAILPGRALQGDRNAAHVISAMRTEAELGSRLRGFNPSRGV